MIKSGQKESPKAATSGQSTTCEKSLCIVEPTIIKQKSECKGDIDMLALLCIEIAKRLHDAIGLEATQEILFDSRGPR